MNKSGSSKTTRSTSLTSLSRRNSIDMKSNDDSTPCGACSKPLAAESIECELCKLWFDLKCVKLVAGDIRTIKKPGVHWFCEKCDKHGSHDGMSNADAHEKRIESLEKNLESLKKSIDESFSKHSELVKKSYADLRSSGRLARSSEDSPG